MKGARAIEDIAGAQRELVGERPRQLRIDAFELDCVDDAFVDGQRQHARVDVEHHGSPRERISLLVVPMLDSFADGFARVGQRLADDEASGAQYRRFGQLLRAPHLHVSNGWLRLWCGVLG